MRARFCVQTASFLLYLNGKAAAAARTNAAIDASLRAEAQTTRLGKMKKI